jgi:hypothetical protein
MEVAETLGHAEEVGGKEYGKRAEGRQKRGIVMVCVI